MITYKSYINPYIGTSSDSYPDETLMARTETLLDHVHGASYSYPSMLSGITVAKAAGAWAAMPASKTEIVPASTITDPFDIHFIHCSSISATGEYQLNLYKGGAGAEVLIAQIPISRTSNLANEGSLPVMTGIQAANTRISAALSGSPAGTESIVVKIVYHTY